MLTTAIPASDAPERSADASTPGPGRRTSSAVALAAALAVIGASAGIAYCGGREVALVAADASASTSIAAGPDAAPADQPQTPDGQPGTDAPSHDPAADAVTATSSSAGSDAAPATAPSGDGVVQQLGVLRAASLGIATLDGRWVAQVASKSVGSVDPLQTASDGTHVFRASDILAEHQRLSSSNADADHVLLLTGTDFGQRSTSPDGEPYWITLVDRRFTSSGAVRAWCATAFADLTPQQQADACAPRTLTPPH